MNRPITETSEMTTALLGVYEGVTTGRLASYAALKDFIRGIEGTINRVTLLEHGFRLQRLLNWGFFRDLKPDQHARIWRILVVADRSYPQFGELKRFAAIPDIFLALIDIHGYTNFCREARHNVSRIDLLDRMIQEDISLLCSKFGVINRRVRGDEILILGASPFDVLGAIDSIVTYFSKRRRITDPDSDKKDASHSLELPDFRLSAGISGGQKYASLVITREGDLSGDIVNSAARLQARANKISPDRNRILVTTQVCQALGSPSSNAEKDLMKRFGFFNVGSVEFKGLSIGVYDLVSLPGEAWRMEYHSIMEELLVNLQKGLWRKEVFDNALQLASRLSITCPAFASEEKKRIQITNLTKITLTKWSAGQYEVAVDGFETIISVLKSVGNVDDVVIEYLELVLKHYTSLRKSFIWSIEKMISDDPPFSLGPDERKVFLTLQKHAEMYGNSCETLRLRHASRVETWLKTCETLKASLGVSLLSPK